MKKQISAINPRQTAKITGFLFFILFALLFIPIGIGGLFLQGWESGKIFFLLPFIYGFAVYLICYASCWIYNRLALYLGGIEITLTEMGED